MSLAIALSWNIVFAFILFCILDFFTNKIFSRFWNIIILFIFILVFNITFFDFSFCNYFYSLFDLPSITLVIISGVFLFYYFLDSKRVVIFPFTARVIFIIFGIILYFGFIDILPFDIYHLDIRLSLIVILALSFILYFINHISGYIVLIAMLFYALSIFDMASIYNYIIDPFLWLGCIISAIVEICFKLRQKVKKSQK